MRTHLTRKLAATLLTLAATVLIAGPATAADHGTRVKQLGSCAWC